MRRLAPLLLVLFAAACSETPTTPGDSTPARGLTEITITGLTTGQPVATATAVQGTGSLVRTGGKPSILAASACISCPSRLNPLVGAGTDGTIDLKPVSVSTFTVGSGVGGYRYVSATYQVRNATLGGVEYTSARTNLTFIAIEAPTTLAHTAITRLRKFNGTPSAIDAREVMPTGAAIFDRQPGQVTVAKADALQVYDPTEVSGLNSVSGVTAALPYGFVVSNPSDPSSRTLGGTPGSVYEGMVTFAFKVPLAASPVDDAFTIGAQFLAVDDGTVYVTQTLEETSAASQDSLVHRATALGTTSLRSLVTDDILGNAAEHFCLTPSISPAPSPTAYLAPC